MATVGVSSLGRVRLPAVLLALALLGAGCASERKAEPQRPQTPPAALRPPPKPEPKPKRSKVHVIVFDGDTGAPVRGAVVHVGRFGGRTDHHGVAKIRIARHARLQVQVAKRGYDGFRQRLQFRNRPKVGVRVYQAKLQWTRYGATAGRTQSHPLIRIRPPFREVWSQAVGLMEFPAVVDADVAFVANYQASVRAFSMRNGKPVWRHDLGGIMAASPAVVGEDVVVHAMNGHVYVLDRHNGRIRWSYRTGAPIESSPLVVNGVDYFGDWSGTVWALDLKTHRARWTYRSGSKITSSASYAGGTIFIGDYGGRLLALSPRNGGLRWSGSVNGRVYGTPATENGRVFVPSSTGGSLTAFSTRGARLWSLGTGTYVYASPAVWNGRVYIGSYNGSLYCLSAGSGRVLWRFGSGAAIGGAATVVDGVVYFANRHHRIYGLDARTGRQLMRWPDGDFVPVSGNGRLLLLHGFSRLYAMAPKHRRR